MNNMFEYILAVQFMTGNVFQSITIIISRNIVNNEGQTAAMSRRTDNVFILMYDRYKMDE
jgi:hypothetical protein